MGARDEVALVQVIVSASVLEVSPPFVWMGAGHVHLKVGLPTQELVRALSPFVADLSDTR
jgi:prolyl-tRNA editing enzyme YbaK/EbsC (Cys-tRNA(Pro) deacylase)